MLLCIVDYKFPIGKKTDGFSTDNLIRVTKIVFCSQNLDIQRKQFQMQTQTWHHTNLNNFSGNWP